MTWDPGCRSVAWPAQSANPTAAIAQPDRKSTRLNSSHLGISYAVFCLVVPRYLHSFPTRRSSDLDDVDDLGSGMQVGRLARPEREPHRCHRAARSEEHTSELQSLRHLVCRLLLGSPAISTLFPYTTLFRS